MFIVSEFISIIQYLWTLFPPAWIEMILTSPNLSRGVVRPQWEWLYILYQVCSSEMEVGVVQTHLYACDLPKLIRQTLHDVLFDSESPRSRSLYFVLRNTGHIFNGGQVWNCRQASQVPTLICSPDTMWMDREQKNGFAIVLLEKAGMWPKKTSGWQHMLCQNLDLPHSINGASTDVQVSHAMGINR